MASLARVAIRGRAPRNPCEVENAALVQRFGLDRRYLRVRVSLYTSGAFIEKRFCRTKRTCRSSSFGNFFDSLELAPRRQILIFPPTAPLKLETRRKENSWLPLKDCAWHTRKRCNWSDFAVAAYGAATSVVALEKVDIACVRLTFRSFSHGKPGTDTSSPCVTVDSLRRNTQAELVVDQTFFQLLLFETL